ncbi:21 kDa protein [Morus notabilis]|uniref:21 kDa protein n=1 Tax=Morus notabilis TaxID=981085 RepID=W9RGG9_9ROSA|nr:pectinesterase inhibitor 7 [Morus notabilis]EXB54443.1 21 kDa protein [Morus notabilis]
MENSYSLSHKPPTILLLLSTNLMVMMINIPMITSTRPVGEHDTNTQFVKTSCGATSYPDLCFTTLSCHASQIKRSPKLLATAALSETLKTVRSASTAMSKLSKAKTRHGLTPRDAEALSDCVEELRDSVEELQRSIEEMGVGFRKKENNGTSEFGLRMSDIETWVSAALTDEDTCVDGFSEKFMNGSSGSAIKSNVRGHIMNVAHMTRNALALVNHYALLHS